MAQTIQYQSTLPALMQSLLGTKSSQTSGGSSSSSSSTGTANIDPLMQVFDQALAAGQFSSGDMQQLIQSIFQEGAQAVPQLTSQYANATGSRVQGNSGLQLALNDLNKQMTSTAAKAVLDNRNTSNQIASGAAGNIAQATRGQTTNATTTPTTTTATQGIANPGAGLGLAGAGFLLNQADKRGWLDSIKLNPAPAATPTIDNTALPTGDFSRMDRAAGFQETATPTFQDVPSGVDIGGDYSNVAAPSGNGDFGFSDVATPGIDFSGAFSDAVGDAVSSAIPEYTPWESGDSWFANGGRPRMMSATARPQGYADGGAVKNESIFSRRTAALDAGERVGVSGGSVNEAFQARLKGLLTPTQPVTTAPATVQTPTPTAPQREITEIRFADGGVVRNRNNMGSRAMSAPTTDALNYRQRGSDFTGMSEGSSGGASSTAGGGGGAGMNSDFMGNLSRAGGQMQGEGGNAVSADASSRGKANTANSTSTSANQEGINGTTGVVGTPEQNAAMVNGFMGTLAAGMLGVPSIAISAAQKAVGMPTKSLNPISVITSLLSDAMSGTVDTTPSSPVGSIAMQDPKTGAMMSSTPGLADPYGTLGLTSNASYAANPSDFSKALSQALSVSPSFADDTGEGGVVGGGVAPETKGGMSTVGVGPVSGPMSTTADWLGQFSQMNDLFGNNNSSSGVSVGSTGIDTGLGRGGESGPERGGFDGGGADIGGGGDSRGGADAGTYNNGGRVKGPGTGTSDSIDVESEEPGGQDISYSDNEFVIPNDVTKITGFAPWQAMIDAFHIPAPTTRPAQASSRK